MANIIIPEKQRRTKQKILLAQFGGMCVMNYIDSKEFKTLVDNARKSRDPFHAVWNGLYNSGMIDKWLDVWQNKHGEEI